MRTAVGRQQRQWIISALLIALFVRALIPAGFMPAMDRPLSFQICPDGYPAQLLHKDVADAHAHHHPDASGEHAAHAGHDAASTLGESATHSHHGIASGEHCVFAAVAAVGAFTFNSAFLSFALEKASTRDIPIRRQRSHASALYSPPHAVHPPSPDERTRVPFRHGVSPGVPSFFPEKKHELLTRRATL